MSRFVKSKDCPIHVIPDSIKFSIFTTEEIKKLCVTKIVTPLTLDALGHPLRGGLYDKDMGPMSDKSDPCGTCLQGLLHCPGHLGYIELPLPVVNPLFHKIIGTLMKISCLHCFKVQIPDNIKCTVIMQLKLISCGLILEANEIECKMKELLGKYENISDIPEEDSVPIYEYEELVRNIDKADTNQTKTTEILKTQALDSILKHMHTRKACMFCKKPVQRIQSLKNKIIMSVIDGHKAVSKNVFPEESRQALRQLWEVEKELLLQIVPLLQSIDAKYPTDVFYFDVIPVTPPNLRPVNIIRDRISENAQTELYKVIVSNSNLTRLILSVVKNKTDIENIGKESQAMYNTAQGNTPLEKLNYLWEELQKNVDGLLDREISKTDKGIGLKQLIEKKNGIIRMHMMGKRVNYAARSVITPDPNLNINEIGIPEAFAKHLVYPEPVTPWNVVELRKMVMNGPNIHPGAVLMQNEDGIITKINPDDRIQRESIAKRLMTPDYRDSISRGVKTVYRHLCNGDIMLLNRQPTLHKPSIMAHTARILQGEKTLRLHYANCKAYNADFDGDEMNAHFPQNELARSEGYYLANVSNQYLVPKDGTPLSGLIQDHVIGGSKLTMRGRFFTVFDYQHYVFQGLGDATSDIKLLPPAIVKPYRMWSGKQIVSTVILNIIPSGKEAINLTATSKISTRAWQTSKPRQWLAGGAPFKNDSEMSEAEVVIRRGELLSGILDKMHYGSTPYGLVHCVYELYGSRYAIKLLSAFSKLFTSFLQREGFTLGVQDILVMRRADKKRKRVVEEAREVGKAAVTKALAIAEDTPDEEVVVKIEEAFVGNPNIRTVIDREYKSALDSYTNKINRICLPAGLVTKFPDNNLQLMVLSGAKGSTVNTMQISCLLGQIELEGKRPPVTISGKSLPSFPATEFSPRAGGFVDGRFMTGIRMQEFFFHCMAGREGLIDTAVKTSRSGYLQRCLIKHLEGLIVNYDLTVRDSDKRVIQFNYGEDGLDISKAQFLQKKQLPFLAENSKAIIDKSVIKTLKKDDGYKEMKAYQKKFVTWKQLHGNPLKRTRRSAFHAFCGQISDKLEVENPGKINKKTGRSRMTRHLVDLWQKVDSTVKRALERRCERCPDTVNSKFQADSFFGSVNERLASFVDEFESGEKGGEKKFDDMIKMKAMNSLCPPGEPVGLLAAQSVGEPSTQMTLNTFHFAGRGEMNVTLGIPRLREILMEASKKIKTPSMEIPFLDVPDLDVKAERLKKILTRVVVANVLEKVDISSEVQYTPVRQQCCTLRFHFLPHEFYKSEYNVKPKRVLKHMTKKFFAEMFQAIRKFSKSQTDMVSVENEKKKGRRGKRDDDDDDDDNKKDSEGTAGNAQLDDDSSDEEPEDVENAKLCSKYAQAHEDQEPEDGEDEEERDLFDDSEETQKPDEENTEKKVETEQDLVLNSYSYATNYVYDTKQHLWCEITFTIQLLKKKLDITALIKECAAKSVVWETPNIKRAITYTKNDRLVLRTDGINMTEMFKYDKILDLNRLYSNDIHKIAQTYGIEAATKVVVKEVKDVFSVYGIVVDPRHLSLIADYMTASGVFEPLNRKGMESSTSPLHQMSFESSLVFLKNAIARGKEDNLQNPSSSLMLGKPCSTGTGANFTLLHKLPVQ